jgi:hypothetical protein
MAYRQFNAGDPVVAVDFSGPTGRLLELGSTYTVKSYVDGDMLLLEEKGNVAFYQGRFALSKSTKKTNLLQTQVGGSHYTDMTIQPIEYILANNIPFPEGNVIKYVSRWRAKGGVKDLEKAKHHLELLIEHELAQPVTAESAK